MKRLLVSALLAMVASTLVAAPGTAGTANDGYVTVRASDLTLWPEHCGNAPYSASASFPGASSWDVNVTVYDPHGVWANADSFSNAQTSTSGSTYLCQDYDIQGTYRVVAEYEAYDENFNTIYQGSVTTTFALKTRPKVTSTLTMKKSKLGKKRWKIMATVTRGGGPWGSHGVAIQALVYGSWENLKTKTSNSSGKVTFTSRPTKGAGKYRIRLHSTGGNYVQDANSRVFRLKHR